MNFHIHHYHHDSYAAELLRDLIGRVAKIERKVDKMAVDLTSLTAAVEKQTTVTESAITLIQGLADQIRNLPANQAAIDDLAAQVDAQAQSMADAVDANT